MTMTDTAHTTHTGRKRAGGFLSTLSLLLSLVLVVALVIFVLQNSNSTTIDFLGWNLDLSQGVALLGAAVVGAVIAFFVSGALRVRRAVR
ncbi:MULTISPECIES: lipopolysaccharide assembly protein LapA domain-containing protein [Nocardiaceae]|uniref:LapA family protein n=3 Tax=Rhodococcoides TaxID=3259750 RepID=A0ABS7NV42_9NOCA|nr:MULTISPECIES: LapA family protein [Rhodococcus]MBT1191344.1 LapA family protein [Rhodococcus kroppenstedtii]MBY6314102.1 LapA family protein [Rhodococcus kroppenstedtii]MBY6321875.1 LapA family protein [Rhodococcus kroppenstedtii]MBY6400883.1 LapA family protein [Rhodococcus kroppenstedtii]MBY6437267.1 LapA family protein [Rhodococcus kroppenstedtii]